MQIFYIPNSAMCLSEKILYYYLCPAWYSFSENILYVIK